MPLRGRAGEEARPPPRSLSPVFGGPFVERKACVGVEAEIQAMVDRETSAWDRQDADALVDLFHPDMVWPWPPDANAHDPISWVFPQGRFNRDRWRADWQRLFATCELVHNRRQTLRIQVSAERDAGFAVVDVDTLWRRRSDGESFLWKGRACKGYTKVGVRWYLILHTGLLEYAEDPGHRTRR